MCSFDFFQPHKPNSDLAMLDAYEFAISELPAQKQKIIREAAAKRLLSEYDLFHIKPVWTGRGEALFFDPWTKIRFFSSFNTVESALNKARKRLSNGDKHIPISDIYSDFNVPLPKYMKLYGFTQDIRFEIKVIDVNGIVNNVIFYLTRPTSLL